MPDTPPIVDALCRVGPWLTRVPGQPYTMESLLAEHARFGIKQRLCIHYESLTGWSDEGNDAMTALANSTPGTGAIWAVLPPRRFDGPAVDGTLSAAQRAEVALFTMNPRVFMHSLDLWANAPLYAAMEKARLPLLINADGEQIRTIHEIAEAHPRLPIVLWNLMYNLERPITALMDLHKEVYLCPAPRFVLSDLAERFTRRYGPHRLIFGSAWPVIEYAQAVQD